MDTKLELLRAARLALGISQQELAEEADVSIRSVSRLETGLHTSLDILKAVQKALEARGIEFLARDAGIGYGFRMPPDWAGTEPPPRRRRRRT